MVNVKGPAQLARPLILLKKFRKAGLKKAVVSGRNTPAAGGGRPVGAAGWDRRTAGRRMTGLTTRNSSPRLVPNFRWQISHLSAARNSAGHGRSRSRGP